MKTINHLITFLSFLFFTNQSFAQLSQGGEPLPPRMLRHASSALFVEMESFDTESMIKEDSMAARHNRANRFAKKFFVDLRPENSGIRYTLADGTKVWQCGIRSKNAYSINLLFSEYHLPKGAKLFIYNSSRTHKIGAFTEANNGVYNKLPTSPVYGDEVIVEYQEPANAEFEGKIAIGEVNHDYRGLTLRGRPGSLSTQQTCHLDAACFPQYEEVAQAVTLLIINGDEYCTGCLVNNVEQDGTPYLLSAAHCFLPTTNATSEVKAQNTVIFFNYQSPTCQTTIIGTEEMSLASAELVANENTLDLTLLRLAQKPPKQYRPYYAGWNANTPADPTYFGIHHPMSKTKKILTSVKDLSLVSYTSTDCGYSIQPDIHWLVSRWLDGTTEGGSSGSPLFDSKQRVIGALTGGASYCSNPRDDYYYAIQKVWEYFPENNRQLKYWLDPKNSGQRETNGFNPYPDSACIRLSNVGSKEKFGISYLSGGETGPVFGHNSLQTQEFAERFITAKQNKIYGFHFVAPAWDSSSNGKVTFRVYDGFTVPNKQLASTTLQLSYLSYSRGLFKEFDKPNTPVNDNYVAFEHPIEVDYSFFIGYQIEYPTTDPFEIYNVLERPSPFNSLYVNDIPKGWKALPDYQPFPSKSSLWLDAVLSLGKTVDSPIDTILPPKIIYDRLTRAMYFKGLIPVSEYQIRIFDTSGKMVVNETVNSNSYILLHRLKMGIYLVNLQGETQVIRQKIAVF